MSRRRVLFFTRGRGRGHAIPDLAILAELQRLTTDVEWIFASYATGAATLAAAGAPLVDLHLGDDPPYLEVLIRATHTLNRLKPDLVVSHEEFAALPASKSFGRPTVFLVDFFPLSELRRDSLRYADRILFIEHRGIFPEPPQLAGRVQYLGPVVRPLTVSRADRARVRAELGLDADGRIIAIIPGAWANEQRAPIADLVLPAFRKIAGDGDRLMWVAGADREAIAKRLQDTPGVTLFEEFSPIERLMVCSDLVITKANRGTIIDLDRLGVPSVSLSFGLNPVDEAIVPRLRSNLALDARGIDGAFLGEVVERLLSSGEDHRPGHFYNESSAADVAREITAMLEPGGYSNDGHAAVKGVSRPPPITERSEPFVLDGKGDRPNRA
jgi:UDP-N-acetylglucosamine:LPS N-acetylglucosamine transferase